MKLCISFSDMPTCPFLYKHMQIYISVIHSSTCANIFLLCASMSVDFLPFMTWMQVQTSSPVSGSVTTAEASSAGSSRSSFSADSGRSRHQPKSKAWNKNEY